MDLAGRGVSVRVLVVNAGSSSLKLRLLSDADAIEHSADLKLGAGGSDDDELLNAISGWPEPAVVGHRIVHGGTRFTGPVRIDERVREELDELTSLAPLHQPKSLAALDAVSHALAGITAVACFDTAFHTTIPPEASTYAVPLEWRERYAIRRYGFHGLSHAYAVRRSADLVGQPADHLRIVTCHLGAGASVCAVRGGRSVDTTMGFTPLDGLVMATRSGSIDPGLVLWLEEQEHLTPREVADALEHRSGLLGLAGTGDLQVIERSAAQGDPRAQLALEVYVHSIVAGIAAMAAATGGLDVLVFTGGVGENSPLVRTRVAGRLSHLGVVVDDVLNADAVGDVDVSASASAVRVLVIGAREDLEIAAGARAVMT